MGWQQVLGVGERFLSDSSGYASVRTHPMSGSEVRHVELQYEHLRATGSPFMTKWSNLADDMKMCVTIYRERKAGREVWFTRLSELLKDYMSRLTISKNEDRLMDLGILDKEYVKVDGKWTYCYRIGEDARFFVKNVAENLVLHDGLIDCSEYPKTEVRKTTTVYEEKVKK
jgi:hypothetical protein